MNYNQPYLYGMWGNQPAYQQNQINNQYQQTQQYSQYPQQYQQYQQPQCVNGKVVDSVDVVRATEVPMGGSGIFPKADMSEIYVKTWNPDGTTKILTFKPVIEQAEAPTNEIKNEDILAQISALNAKIDKLTSDLGG